MQSPEPDLLATIIAPVAAHVSTAVGASGWLPGGTGAVAGITHSAAVALFAGALAGIGMSSTRNAVATLLPAGAWAGAANAMRAAAAAIAVGLLGWILLHPSPNVTALLVRLDHLALCASAGFALSRVSIETRKWVLSVVSLSLLGQHAGWIQLTPVIVAGLLGFAVLRVPRFQSARWTALTQTVILAGPLWVCWRVRSFNLIMALQTQGLYAWMLLRHISFVVETRRGRPTDLGRYLCYLLFYTSFIGSSEIYSEFYERNLTAAPRYDYWQVATKLIVGQVQMALALLVPVSSEGALQIQNSAPLWGYVLLVFVRSALFVMGLWAFIEGCALLYGVQLRPNFDRTLWCENPSQFWRSWRGTMTNWLIHYVYVPLGGNRRRQARNIGAAFVVSAMWHWMGIPFFAMDIRPIDFLPIALWGALNACGVIGYAFSRRRSWRVLPERTPNAVRRSTKILLTACLGSLTVMLLDFRPATRDQFPAFVRALVGLGLQ
jgi:D-alanyl-lipoteichoic acid acyltransferase DltB (MBOAT superfamily)